MAPSDIREQLIKYLTDAHSIEQQAIVQMERAPEMARDPVLAAHFVHHLDETRAHERMVRDRLEALGASPAALKDAAGKVTGFGFVLFARFNPDTTGKLVAHGYSYEHMELAAYALLAGVADRAGDELTVSTAREIEAQEQAMAERLAGCFDAAVETSLREKSADDIQEELSRYLEDAHALEGQSIQLLEKAPGMAGDPRLADAFKEHLIETREHQRLVEARLQARHTRPSRLKDAALRLGALNWGMFFAAQPDTPAKLAGFAYAVEHLEVAAYELLRRVAQRAGDTESQGVAERILAQERAAGLTIHGLFDAAIEAGLREQGVAIKTASRR